MTSITPWNQKTLLLVSVVTCIHLFTEENLTTDEWIKWRDRQTELSRNPIDFTVLYFRKKTISTFFRFSLFIFLIPSCYPVRRGRNIDTTLTCMEDILYSLTIKRNKNGKVYTVSYRKKKRWRGSQLDELEKSTSLQGSTRLGWMSYFSCFGGLYRIEKLAPATQHTHGGEYSTTLCSYRGVSGQVPNIRQHTHKHERAEGSTSVDEKQEETEQARSSSSSSNSPFVVITFWDSSFPLKYTYTCSVLYTDVYKEANHYFFSYFCFFSPSLSWIASEGIVRFRFCSQARSLVSFLFPFFHFLSPSCSAIRM